MYTSSVLALRFWVEKGPAAEATRAPQPWGLLCKPYDEDEEKGDQFVSFFQVMEHRWNELVRRKSKYLGKNLSQCHFVHHKSHKDWPGIEPGPPLWNPATNRLSHGTTTIRFLVHWCKMLCSSTKGRFHIFDQYFRIYDFEFQDDLWIKKYKKFWSKQSWHNDGNIPAFPWRDRGKSQKTLVRLPVSRSRVWTANVPNRSLQHCNYCSQFVWLTGNTWRSRNSH
jgi:hypothetical protein